MSKGKVLGTTYSDEFSSVLFGKIKNRQCDLSGESYDKNLAVDLP